MLRKLLHSKGGKEGKIQKNISTGHFKTVFSRSVSKIYKQNKLICFSCCLGV